jgi:catalase
VAAISVLHAKGSSAFGQLLISEDISRYTTVGGVKPGTTTRSGGGSPPVLGSNK